MGASSFSPSPITTMPSMGTLSSTMRIASTAAPSAPILSPRPIQRDAARAAASVTLTSSMARLRSGRCFSGLPGNLLEPDPPEEAEDAGGARDADGARDPDGTSDSADADDSDEPEY